MSVRGVTQLLLLVLNNVGSPGARDSLVHSPYLILNSLRRAVALDDAEEEVQTIVIVQRWSRPGRVRVSR